MSDEELIGFLRQRSEMLAAQRIEELAAELSRLSALVAGWRPMDSAPKDGTRFLALQGDRHFDCWWKDAGYGEAYWQDDADSEPDPTHWRPLPAPPVSQLKDTTNADK